MSDQIRKALNIQTRVLSEKDGTVEYIASDASLDSYFESILSSGWKFTLFAKNSPFVDSHNYWSIEALLGKVTSARVEGGQLIETVQWAHNIPEHKLASIGWKLTVGGFLKAVSVGFRVVKSAWPSDTGWSGFVAAAGLSPEDAAKCRRIFIEQEQLELSACVLGANPSAVAKAYKEGCIRDADLAAVGFGDDDLHFLSVAGAAAEDANLSTVSRLLIEREMKRITSRSYKTGSSGGNSSTSMPGKPDGGEEVMRQAAERADFLRQFQDLVK